MSQRIKVSVTLDKKRAKAVKKALKELPPKFRGKQIIQAQKKIMKPTRDAVTASMRTQFDSTTLDDKTIQIVQGKYVKKTSPYVVVQARDKAKLHRRLRKRYSSVGKTNWFKIDHMVAGGTKRGPRTAGQSTRQATVGRERVKVFDESGKAEMKTRSTQGRTFLVNGPRGLHPIKKIKHPGTEPYGYYDKAYRTTQASARNKFYEYVANEITSYKQKRGIK